MNTNGYPFTSRRQILERISTDATFAVSCVSIIEERKGWMASHRARASKLVARLAAGAPTPADYAEALELAARYGKTLARVFRDRELAARPELAAVGAAFGVGPVPATAPTVASEAGKDAPSQEEASSEPVPARKKRGRPVGSKNRPKDAPKPVRRRRT